VRRSSLLLLVPGLVRSLAAQGNGSPPPPPPPPPPAVAVLGLRFDGEHANVVEFGDTAIAGAATSALLATLRAAPGVGVIDSARVAAAVAADEASGNACDHACALHICRALGARWVARGRLMKTSNLIWLLAAELFEVATDRTLLADSYEIKGDATRMAPAGARVFAQRIARAVTTQERP
jgi:hypothetical protein